MMSARRFLLVASGAVAMAQPVLVQPVLAETAPAASVTVIAQSRDFSDSRGALNQAALEYRRDLGATDFMVGASWSQQRLATATRSAVGGRAALSHQWSKAISTTTTVAAAQDVGIVPWLELGQEVNAKVGGQVVATLGARLARYQGEDVVFASGGLRRYFKGGSVSYRLTRALPQHGPGFFAHLVNLSLNDRVGAGRTQLWAALGTDPDNRSPDGQRLSGKDWSVALRRVQPLAGKGRGAISLAPFAGYTSYALPGGRVGSFEAGLGLTIGLD